MIQLLHEVLGWLGYLQRPAVLIQILLVLAIVSIKALPSNRQYSKVPSVDTTIYRPRLALFSVHSAWAIELSQRSRSLLRDDLAGMGVLENA